MKKQLATMEAPLFLILLLILFMSYKHNSDQEIFIQY